jgi:DNA-directed RNA polymerase subunit RPC12/RpoP
MKILIFLIVIIILSAITIYFTINKKIKCTKCSSQDINRTGEKRYKEDPSTIWGSTNSYWEIEYKCNRCGNVFWDQPNAPIFN